MGGAQQPYMYSPARHDDARFPETKFDPKAVTRASWEPKPRKPKQEGPLISFNRHPDAHMVLSYRSGNYPSMNPHTKTLVKWLRIVQLMLRVLELAGAIGLLVLMILITKVEAVSGWILRIVPGVAILHCVYGAYHLSRDAGGRPPASSAAYQFFAAMTDLGVAPLYAFGALTVHNNHSAWTTLLADKQLMDIFVPAVYYTFIGAGSLHLASLSLSLWLGWMFRKITLMPPDMNPLERHLTARPQHKRNKSSVTTLSTVEDEKRLSTPLEARRRSGVASESYSRPPSIPFMHTRTQSTTSVNSRNSRADLPSRQSYIAPNSSRNSISSNASPKRSSAIRSSHHGSYTEIPLEEPNWTAAPSIKSNSVKSVSTPPRSNPPRAAKFTETWLPTDSLISRTNQRHRQMAAAKASADNRSSKSYASLAQPYNMEDSSEDEEYGDENRPGPNYDDADVATGGHPHPLRQNPALAEASTPPRIKTPFHPTGKSLTEVSPNTRRVSASQDIADEKLGVPLEASARNRQSSIQGDEAFYARPYGDLTSATPPIMVGDNRKVSSGNDYDSKYTSPAYARRNVSGKIVEEGRSGTVIRHSRYELRSGGKW